MNGQDIPNENTRIGFGRAVGAGFRRYGTISGRSSRSEFWYWALYCYVWMAAFAIAGLLMDDGSLALSGYVIFGLVHFVPGLAVTVRRLHDIDRSGWWLLLMFVPVIGLFAALLLIAWFTIKGTPGENRFGPDPCEIDEVARENVALTKARQAYEQGNCTLAAILFQPLAERGDPYAQATLGLMHLNGEGVRQDYIQAYKWLALAMSRFRESDEAARGKARRDLAFLETRALLGMTTQPVRVPKDARAAAGQEHGLLVADVEDDSPAAKGAVALGDVLLAINGSAVERIADLFGALADADTGAQVQVRVLRGGATKELAVTVGTRPAG